MSREEVFSRLTKIFREVFDDENIELREDTTAVDIDDWDSFEHVNLIVGIEDEFSLKIPADRVLAIQNVGEMADLILEIGK